MCFPFLSLKSAALSRDVCVYFSELFSVLAAFLFLYIRSALFTSAPTSSITIQKYSQSMNSITAASEPYRYDAAGKFSIYREKKKDDKAFEKYKKLI